MIARASMRRTLAAIVLAALPTLAAVPALAHEQCTLTHHIHTDAGDLLAPRQARDARSGFGGWPPDYVIECLGGDDADGLRW